MPTQMEVLKSNLPRPVKRPLAWVRSKIIPKNTAAITYWKTRHQEENGRFLNDWYQRRMLWVAGESDPGFLKSKVVADFGCGPRGSLLWAKDAELRLGLDVLSQLYSSLFPGDVVSHNMLYVTTTEHTIPIPSDLVDIMYSVNSLDHVDNLSDMCDEIVRVMRPGGELIASFNLNEYRTASEPQTLTTKRLENVLLSRFETKRQDYFLKYDGDQISREESDKKKCIMIYRGKLVA